MGAAADGRITPGTPAISIRSIARGQKVTLSSLD
jgi:hypothetical protein